MTDLHILIADRQPMFRAGLIFLLMPKYPEANVHEATDFTSCWFNMAALPVQLLIVEAQFLRDYFPRGGAPLRSARGLVSVVAVTEPGDEVGALACLAAGATTTVSRTETIPQIMAKIQAAINHEGVSYPVGVSNLVSPRPSRLAASTCYHNTVAFPSGIGSSDHVADSVVPSPAQSRSKRSGPGHAGTSLSSSHRLTRVRPAGLGKCRTSSPK